VPRNQLLGGTIGGVLAGFALLALLRLYQGGELFGSERMTVVRAGIGVCLVALGLWAMARTSRGSG
jgi:hypothetical protein